MRVFLIAMMALCAALPFSPLFAGSLQDFMSAQSGDDAADDKAAEAAPKDEDVPDVSLDAADLPDDTPGSQSLPPRREMKELEYLPVTRATLSQLYWKMGAYDVENDIDVDNFMLLNKCDLYKDNYRDDFAWHKIRVKAQASLKKNMDSFPTRFYIVQPIWLGRYSVMEETFPLAVPIRTSRFELKAIDDEEWECSQYSPSGGRIWKYPSQAVLTFSTPLEVQSIEVSSDVAKLYNDMYAHMGLYARRPAFIVTKFKVFEAYPVEKKKALGGGNGPAQISAVVEQVDFYADFDQKLHLSTLDFRRRNKSRMTGEGVDKK